MFHYIDHRRLCMLTLFRLDTALVFSLYGAVLGLPVGPSDEGSEPNFNETVITVVEALQDASKARGASGDLLSRCATVIVKHFQRETRLELVQRLIESISDDGRARARLANMLQVYSTDVCATNKELVRRGFTPISFRRMFTRSEEDITPYLMASAILQLDEGLQREFQQQLSVAEKDSDKLYCLSVIDKAHPLLNRVERRKQHPVVTNENVSIQASCPQSSKALQVTIVSEVDTDLLEKNSRLSLQVQDLERHVEILNGQMKLTSCDVEKITEELESSKTQCSLLQQQLSEAQDLATLKTRSLTKLSMQVMSLSNMVITETETEGPGTSPGDVLSPGSDDIALALVRLRQMSAKWGEVQRMSQTIELLKAECENQRASLVDTMASVEQHDRVDACVGTEASLFVLGEGSPDHGETGSLALEQFQGNSTTHSMMQTNDLAILQSTLVDREGELHRLRASVMTYAAALERLEKDGRAKQCLHEIQAIRKKIETEYSEIIDQTGSRMLQSFDAYASTRDQAEADSEAAHQTQLNTRNEVIAALKQKLKETKEQLTLEQAALAERNDVVAELHAELLQRDALVQNLLVKADTAERDAEALAAAREELEQRVIVLKTELQSRDAIIAELTQAHSFSPAWLQADMLTAKSRLEDIVTQASELSVEPDTWPSVQATFLAQLRGALAEIKSLCRRIQRELSTSRTDSSSESPPTDLTAVPNRQLDASFPPGVQLTAPIPRPEQVDHSSAGISDPDMDDGLVRFAVDETSIGEAKRVPTTGSLLLAKSCDDYVDIDDAPTDGDED
ncbi:Coiled-coil protein [Giardia muris]|uniref:Coiled-coil protein n=1 Tax=Giardia muris TaxID=5742 RepID=A0A4Z1TDP5_GIAMU|nr:Coiled-coil protein [Giardia muris]|eukprot:TNJ30671.1 Coiled-coil protein [Giardia muris]